MKILQLVKLVFNVFAISIHDALQTTFPLSDTMIKQEIRSVDHGYLSNCFKSRTRDLGHAPFGSFIIPYVVLAMAYPKKKKQRV